MSQLMTFNACVQETESELQSFIQEEWNLKFKVSDHLNDCIRMV